MSNTARPIALLIEATEEVFHLEKGDILREDRSQPISSIRQLSMKVARERGFNASRVARAFNRDRNTVWTAVENVNARVGANRPWWLSAKNRLNAAWDAKLYPQSTKDVSHGDDPRGNLDSPERSNLPPVDFLPPE